MSAVWVIFRKEWQNLFASPMAYVTISVFLFLLGYFFFGLLGQFQFATLSYQSFVDPSELNLNDMVIAPLYSYVCILWLFLLPLMTMRLIAEERKMQTFVLLLTAPVKLSHIVIGKFLAGLAFLLLLLAICFVYPLVCVVFGNAEWGPVLAANLGLFAIGAVFIALGLWASSFTRNPMLAAVLGFGFILFFWTVDFLKDIAENAQFLSELSILSHLEPFFKGIVDTYHLAFYGIFVVVVLALTQAQLERQRWR